MVDKVQRRNRIALILILGLPFLSWALATASFHFRIGIPEATTNNGHIVSAEIHVDAFVLPPTQSPLMWRLLVPIDKHWDEERYGFLQRLYLAIGRDRHHLEVVLLSTKGSEFPSELPSAFSAHSANIPIPEPEAGADTSLCLAGEFNDCWYIVSDKGELFLSYPATTSDRALLDDLMRVLRHIPDTEL